MKNKILIFRIKNIILYSILTNCSVILQNSRRNIIISSFLFKISLEIKIFKRKFLEILIIDPN